MEQIGIENLVEELHRRFQERLEKNPSYTISSYARLLGINESSLRKIIHGRRQLGGLLADKLASKWGYQLEPVKKNRLTKFATMQFRSPQLSLLIFMLGRMGLPAAVIERMCVEEFKVERQDFINAQEDLQTMQEVDMPLIHLLKVYEKDLRKRSAG